MMRKKMLAMFWTAILWDLTVALPVQGQPAAPVAAIKNEVRQWNEKGAQVQVTLTDGRTLRGRIVRADSDTFLLRPKSGADETVQYAMVTQIRKQGGIKKAVWIPLIIGGAAVVVLCAAPYPIGFLCHSDPS
jgi:hypothetical protein